MNLKYTLPSAPAKALALGLLLSAPLFATYSWGPPPSALDGGGTQNALAVDPSGSGVIISGSDVSGLQRSADKGVTWQTVNLPTTPGAFGTVQWSNTFKVATVVFDPNRAGYVYAGEGDAGKEPAGSGTGGFLVSTDYGQDWTLVSDSTVSGSNAPVFSGNGEDSNYPNLPGWPRSTGNLIACDTAGTTKYLYAGTFRDGVKRSTDGGHTWTTIGTGSLPSPVYIRSIAVDPASPWNLYVATYGNGVWTTNDARTGAAFTRMTGAPDEVEELLVLDDSSGPVIYAAGADSGADFSKGSGVWWFNGGSSWVSISPAASASTSTWSALAGYTASGGDVLYIGASGPNLAQYGSTSYYQQILKSTDGGAQWTPITVSTTNVNPLIGGTGHSWWVCDSTTQGGTQYGLGLGDSNGITNIQIGQSNRDNVWVGCRAGIWGTTNATQSPTAISWHPLVSGLSVCVANNACADPNNPGYVYVTEANFILFCSNNATAAGAYFTKNSPNAALDAGQHASRALFVDQVDKGSGPNGKPSRLYLATLSEHPGDANDTGNVYSNLDPTTASKPWVDELLEQAMQAMDGNQGYDGRVDGVIVGRDGATPANRIILAAVASSTPAAGLWRCVSSWNSGTGDWNRSVGNWTHLSTTFQAQGAVRFPFAWKRGSANVFAFDNTTGLYRSTDYGQTWSPSPIWSRPGGPQNRSGSMAGSQAVDGTLYIAVNDNGGHGVYRFTNAQSGSTISPAGQMFNASGQSLDEPGPILLANSKLYVANGIGLLPSPHNAQLFSWSSPDTVANGTLISDSAVYPGQAAQPTGLDLDADNSTIYVSCTTNGLLMGKGP